MAADAFIQIRVTTDTQGVSVRVAHRERISESALVRQLIDTMLRTQVRPPPVRCSWRRTHVSPRMGRTLEGHPTRAARGLPALAARSDPLGRLRSEEAFYYLRNIASGHPGSITSIHAGSCALALEQLMLMVRQSKGGLGLSREDIHALIRLMVDVVIQIGVRADNALSRKFIMSPADADRASERCRLRDFSLSGDRALALQRERATIQAQAVAALETIVAAIRAHPGTGQAGRLVSFLACLYNRCEYRFDLSDLRALDTRLANACLDYLNYDRLGIRDLDQHLGDGGRELRAWIEQYKLEPTRGS